MLNYVKCVLLFTSIAVFCAQFSTANGQAAIKDPVSKAPSPTASQGTNTKKALGNSSFSSLAASIAPTSAFTAKAAVTQLMTSNVTMQSKGNATTPDQGRWPNSGVSARKANKRVRFRQGARKRRKGWVTVRRSRRTKNKVTKITTKNNATINGTTGNQTRLHPCNSVHASKMEYKVNNIECRRWYNNELEQQMNCMGKFNHQYLAGSFEEAMKFRDLDTGSSLDLSKSFILNRQSSHRQKKGAQIDPGETLIVRCHGGKTPTESGHLRICPVCTAITRQPSTPRRFPEYINELLCDPQMVSNYLPGIDAFCVQKILHLDLLQFDGDWELDPTLSAEAGHDVYIEKWELYTQTIRRHCACELLPSSPMANLL